jgi:hypothetical protein
MNQRGPANKNSHLIHISFDLTTTHLLGLRIFFGILLLDFFNNLRPASLDACMHATDFEAYYDIHS